MTQINGLYRILNAIEQTYTMVRNSTKLIFACIVLGVVNQACAVGSVGKSPAAEAAPPAALPASEPAPKRELAPSVTSVAASDGPIANTDPLKPAPAAGPEPTAATRAVTVEPPVVKATALPRASGYAEGSRSATRQSGPAAPIVVAQAAAAPRALQQVARTSADTAGIAATSRPAPVAAPVVPTGTAAAPWPAPAEPMSARIADPMAPDHSATPAPMDVALVPAPAAAGPSNITPVALQAPGTPAIVYSDTPTGPLAGNLWDRIRSGYAIPEVESPLVQRHMTWYLNRPEYLERMVERSRRYLHFVVEELESRNMPLEIALLPMIESAYNPVAYSRAHASGIWQFIPDTGRRYGLEQNWWYDGRRDVTEATRAALDYLQKLHNDFGDWQLALAAYNWGEGAVSRAIVKNQHKRKPTDYRSLKMPKETANYLPKLQAVKNIIADPARYGVLLEEIPNQPYFIRVNIPQQIDVKRAAELAGVPLEEFRSLNPAHNRPVITSAGERTVLLPVEKAETFATNLEANDEPLVSWQTYTLKPNEKIEQVAARYGLTVNTLKQVNGIGTRKRLRPGQTLLVPTPAAMQDANLEQSIDPLDFLPSTSGPEMETYRVKSSDSLARIANHFHVTQRQIIRWNHLKGGHIRPGQTLTIYPDTAPVAKGTARAKAPKSMQTVKVKAPAKKAPAPSGNKQHLVRN